MNLIKKIKYKHYKNKENRIYKKFKNCNLPYPFSDDKRFAFDWVYYDKRLNKYEITINLSDALPQSGLIYHYNIENGVNTPIGHCHSFEELLQMLYDYPESFTIPKKYLDEYSKQELDFIKENQNYLKLIGLKDKTRSKEIIDIDNKWSKIYEKKHKNLKDKYLLFKYEKEWDKLNELENLKRYNNSKHEFYHDCYTKYWEDEFIKAAINKKKNNYITRTYSFSESMVGIKYLIVDYDLNYRILIECIKDNYVKFKDLKETMVYTPSEFKNFNEYKKYLKKNFMDDAKIYNEEFNDDSIINCVEFKLIEKF